MTTMLANDVQELCERGQAELVATRYWEAELLLAKAEQLAWEARDFDALSRLYMPLQEARRQRRQRCGEGIVALDLVAEGPADRIDPIHVIANYPHGQLMVAGWATIEPARKVREMAQASGLYVETFLGATYAVGSQKVVVIVPTADMTLPPAGSYAIDDLLRQIPPHAIVLPENQLSQRPQRGNATTYAQIMDLWERLHLPFLALADSTADPLPRMAAYRRVLEVDYACELAHQKLANVAHQMDRGGH